VIALDRLLTDLDIHPVLMEVGGAAHPNEVWDPIARHSTYVGVGPDATSLAPVHRDKFFRTCLIEEVVTPEACEVASFHHTRDGVYSSVLRPNQPYATPYLDSQCWLERERSMTATTISSLLKRFSLDRIDWLQTNTNGLDFKLFRSIEQPIRQRILALDTVFDLVDFWPEHGSPLTGYKELVGEGYWPSRLSSHGFVRMQSKSVQELEALNARFDPVQLGDRLPVAPGWIFARFLRTLESLLAVSSSPVDYATLWTFAVVDDQLGYAADVVFEYRKLFGEDTRCRSMLEDTLERIHRRVEREPSPGPDRRILPWDKFGRKLTGEWNRWNLFSRR
jgi:hypothetical protein